MIASLLLAALVTASSPAQASGDLVYTYRANSEVAPLKGYDGRPYWQVLAECAGAHGALANRYESQGLGPATQLAKTKGVNFLNTANGRIRADRGVTAAEALALSSPHVDDGRAAGAVLLNRPTASGYSHEQLLDVMCAQVDERHARAARTRR